MSAHSTPTLVDVDVAIKKQGKAADLYHKTEVKLAQKSSEDDINNSVCLYISVIGKKDICIELECNLEKWTLDPTNKILKIHPVLVNESGVITITLHGTPKKELESFVAVLASLADSNSQDNIKKNLEHIGNGKSKEDKKKHNTPFKPQTPPRPPANLKHGNKMVALALEAAARDSSISLSKISGNLPSENKAKTNNHLSHITATNKENVATNWNDNRPKKLIWQRDDPPHTTNDPKSKVLFSGLTIDTDDTEQKNASDKGKKREYSDMHSSDHSPKKPAPSSFSRPPFSSGVTSNGNRLDTFSSRTPPVLNTFGSSSSSSSSPARSSTTTSPYFSFFSRSPTNLPSSTKFEGLRNIGNTCYLNAVLQALLGLHSFTEDLSNDKLSLLNLPSSSFYKSLLSVYKEMRTNKGVVNPKAVKDAVGSNSSRFRGSNQEDAHEFLGASLDILAEEILQQTKKATNGEEKEKDKKASTDSDKENKSPVIGDNKSGEDKELDDSVELDSTDDKYINNGTIHENGKKEKPSKKEKAGDDTTSSGINYNTTDCPTTKNFNCEVESAFTCKACENSSRTTELYRDFSLDILSSEEQLSFGMDPDTDPPTITDLLARFFKEDEVERKCEKCGHNAARVTKEIVRLPRVLILHIKRFVPDPATLSYEKNRDRVLSENVLYVDMCSQNVVPPVPVDTTKRKNVGKSNVQKNQRKLYRLHSIVLHRGSTAYFGHYVSYVKEEGKATWKLFDDSMVTTIEEREVLSKDNSKDGYIYFYKYCEEDNV